MIKKTITYTDYNGEERTEDFFFNFTKAEIIEMEMSEEGGLSEAFKKIVASKDYPSLVKEFKKLILGAYGEKSADGKRFIKSKELSDSFAQTEAYSILFTELAQNADEASVFFKGIMPAGIAEAINSEHLELK